MPIGIHTVEGQSRPTIYCDACGFSITDAKDGNYEWSPRTNRLVYFLHKGCSRLHSEQHPELTLTSSMPLDVFPHYLSNNLNIDRKEAAERASWLAS